MLFYNLRNIKRKMNDFFNKIEMRTIDTRKGRNLTVSYQKYRGKYWVNF